MKKPELKGGHTPVPPSVYGSGVVWPLASCVITRCAALLHFRSAGGRLLPQKLTRRYFFYRQLSHICRTKFERVLWKHSQLYVRFVNEITVIVCEDKTLESRVR